MPRLRRVAPPGGPMRRFQFRLERFLDLRRWKEREWEIRLAHATGKVILLKNRIAEIGAEIGASYGRSFTSGAAVDVDAMAGRELYVQRLAAERDAEDGGARGAHPRAGGGARAATSRRPATARCSTSSRSAGQGNTTSASATRSTRRSTT